ICFCSCHARLAPQSTTLNKEVTDEHGKPQLLGKCSRSQLEQAPYDSWFVKNYSDYTVDSATADQLRSKLGGGLNASSTGRDITFTIFMGTWCGDSKREVPRLFKILDYCGIDSSRVRLVMVSAAEATYKQSPDHEERGENIFRVPDFILLDKGKELGRVVESPVLSLEKDLLQLADGRPYIPHYEGVAQLAKVLREQKTKRIEKELPELAGRLKPLLSSASELKSYYYVLKAAGEQPKADLTLRLNDLIFPAGK
ncbi:MAG: hypothetical protein ABUM51_01725, partial [Bacteroidota bacterium]